MNPMGEFRNRVLSYHWECVDRIIGEDYDKSDDRRCMAYNESFSQWLPTLPSPFGEG